MENSVCRTEALSRTEALLGREGVSRLSRSRVLVVGVGGVGGWCAEALVRTGVGHLAIVDGDSVVASNLNRQCAATIPTLGRVKVEALRERLRAVNPACEVAAFAMRYPNDAIDVAAFDAVVDAIDSVADKAELILRTTACGVPLVSSMGAALRLDPTRVRVTCFDKVAGDGLARALRQRFKKLERFPGPFTAVWSDEAPKGLASAAVAARPPYHSVRGSVMPVVATFGMCLASETLKVLVR